MKICRERKSKRASFRKAAFSDDGSYLVTFVNESILRWLWSHLVNTGNRITAGSNSFIFSFFFSFVFSIWPVREYFNLGQKTQVPASEMPPSMCEAPLGCPMCEACLYYVTITMLWDIHLMCLLTIAFVYSINSNMNMQRRDPFHFTTYSRRHTRHHIEH